MLSIYPEFQMKVFGSGTSDSACSAYSHHRPSRYRPDLPSSGIMTINTFQSIIMTHNNYISISSVCFCHTYYSIKRTADSIIGLSLYIRSTVPPASSVCRNHFTTGKRKTIFILFYTIQMNGETFLKTIAQANDTIVQTGMPKFKAESRKN